jgi:hypothetical protein
MIMALIKAVRKADGKTVWIEAEKLGADYSAEQLVKKEAIKRGRKNANSEKG